MPETRSISGAAVVKDEIIVITGVDGRGCRYSKIFVYKPLKDRWQDLGKVPRGFMLAGAASVGDKFYILGGSDLEHILFQCLEGTVVLKEGEEILNERKPCALLSRSKAVYLDSLARMCAPEYCRVVKCFPFRTK